MNLTTLIPQFLAQCKLYCAPASIVTYAAALTKLQKFCETFQVEFSQLILEQYLASLVDSGLKRNSITSYSIGLRAFCTWLLKEKHTQVNIFPEKIRLIGSIKSDKGTFTREEYAKLLKVAEFARWDYWPYAITMGYNTGLRLSDIATLEHAEIEWNKRQIKVIPNKRAKTGEALEIPITTELWAKLHHECSEFHSPEVNEQWGRNYVRGDMAWAYKKDRVAVSSQFCHLIKRAGIVNKDFHSFRRTFVTNLLDKGVSVQIVASMTGHSLAQLMTYARISPESKREALENL